MSVRSSEVQPSVGVQEWMQRVAMSASSRVGVRCFIVLSVLRFFVSTKIV